MSVDRAAVPPTNPPAPPWAHPPVEPPTRDDPLGAAEDAGQHRAAGEAGAHRAAEEPGRRGATGIRRIRDGWRRLPRLLKMIIVVHGLMLLSATVLYPNYRGPDEPLHVDLITAAVQGDATPWPAPGARLISSGVSAGSSLSNGRIAVSAVRPADKAPPRGDRSSFADRGGNRPTRLPNQLVQHPPTYYYLMAPALAVVPHWRDIPFDRVVAWLRAVNALLLLPLPLLGYVLARRVGLTESVATAAAAIPLGVPQLYHIGSAVNNDNLLLPLLAGTSVVAAAVGRGDLRWRTAVGFGLLVGACMLTKGFGLFLPLLIAVAYLVAATRTGLWRAILPGLAAGVVGIGSGGWWWIHNKIAYGVVQPDGTKTVQPNLAAHTTFGQTGKTWAKMFLELMNRRFWLDPGATTLPRAAAVLAVVGAVLVIGGALLTLVVGSPARRDSVLLAIPFFCLLGIVAWGSWDVWQKVISPAGMQGRYLYGALPGVAVLAVGGVGRFAGRRLPLVVLALVAAFQLIGLWLTLRVYWLPPTGSLPRRVGAAGHNILAWSPWPPALVLVLLAGLAVAGAFTVRAAWTTSRLEPVS